jgi:hypothetical protein
MKPQIIKIERTDANVDNSVYEIPVEHTDDYGNHYYIKVTKPCTEYDAEVKAKIDALQAEIDKLNSEVELGKMIQAKEAELSTLQEEIIVI